MKTSTLLKGLLLLAVFSFASCSKEDTDSGVTASDASNNAKMDDIANDITLIAEDQFAEQSSAKMASAASILPSCASVTTVTTSTTWTRTIDFGDTGCVFNYGNGAILKGKIIMSGSTNFSQSPYVWTYSFENFKYNDILVEGTKTFSRTVEATAELATAHPVVVINIDLQLTFPNGNSYDRTGTRTRELIEGFDTPLVFADNVYVIKGSWNTNGANGSYNSTITTPLRIEIACLYKLVSGSIKITRNSHNAVFDYGDGLCDNNATIAIDGGTPHPFTFRN